MNNQEKYLYLQNLPKILQKSWSFCQKEVASWRLDAEKKYHIWKIRWLITEANLLKYLRDNRDRVGNIDEFSVKKFVFTLDELKPIDYEEKNSAPYIEVERNLETYSAPINNIVHDKVWSWKDLIWEMKKMMEEFLKNNQSGQNDKLLIDLEQRIKWYDDRMVKLEQEKEEIREKWEKDKEEIRERLEWEKKEVSDKLVEEMNKVAKIYFISDRFEKMIDAQRQAMEDWINLTKGLSKWEKIKLWEIKRIISSQNINDSLEVSEGWDIKLIPGWNNSMLNELLNLPDDIVLEISRADEVKSLNRSKLMLIILALVLLAIIITLLVLKYLKMF